MIEIRQTGAVGIVTLNRPEARNAISRALTAELSSALDTLQTNPDVTVIGGAGLLRWRRHSRDDEHLAA